MTASKIGKKRILLVEDEPEIREFMAMALEKEGFDVRPAEHALAAVFAIVREKPDLIVTDIRMPIVDGVSLIHEIRSHSDSAHIPVIVVTGLDTQECRDAAEKAGCSGFITKPIDPNRFGAQIREFFSRKKDNPKAPGPGEAGNGQRKRKRA